MAWPVQARLRARHLPRKAVQPRPAPARHPPGSLRPVIRWVLACLLLATPVEAADLTLLTTGAFKPVADAVIPAFEARTGNTVTERNDTAGALVRRIKANEKFDV